VRGVKLTHYRLPRRLGPERAALVAMSLFYAFFVTFSLRSLWNG
jgi:hypothetical protein